MVSVPAVDPGLAVDPGPALDPGLAVDPGRGPWPESKRGLFPEYYFYLLVDDAYDS